MLTLLLFYQVLFQLFHDSNHDQLNRILNFYFFDKPSFLISLL